MTWKLGEYEMLPHIHYNLLSFIHVVQFLEDILDNS